MKCRIKYLTSLESLHMMSLEYSSAISEFKNFNLIQLLQICNNDDKIKQFCMKLGLLPSRVKCPCCEDTLTKLYSISKAHSKSTSYRFQCNRKKCKSTGKNQVCLNKDSIFYKSNLSMEKILVLLYCCVLKLNYHSVMQECKLQATDVTISSATIANIHSKLGKVYAASVSDHICSSAIGGPGTVVEIDEAKFGKRKYNKGRPVEGTWVLGGICRETGDMFMEVVEKRDKATLIPIILRRVHPGTTIITDCWKAYSNLKSHDFHHLTVNHSYNFVGKL